MDEKRTFHDTVDPQKLCMGCMNDLHPGDVFCRHCGYNNGSPNTQAHHLPPCTILNGKYLVGCVLGEGGFGITYIGYDLNLDIKVAIKEFYPVGIVTRSSGTVVLPFSGSKTEFYQASVKKFVNEAKSLAKFYSLPGIVSVKDFFQENGTAYIVMEYIDGITLKNYLEQKGGRMPADELFALMGPLMHSLIEIHKAGVIHRDISPDNIMLPKEGGVKLLDFGTAREFESEENKSRSVLLKPGYAPEEQYRTRGVQGPWTDVYALCATMYKCLTGETPPEAPERMQEDGLIRPSNAGAQLTYAQEAALVKGMAVFAKDRYQNVGELIAGFSQYDGVQSTGTIPAGSSPFIPQFPERNESAFARNKKMLIGIGIAFAALIVIFIGIRAFNHKNADYADATPTETIEASATEVPTPELTDSPRPVEPVSFTPEPIAEPTAPVVQIPLNQQRVLVTTNGSYATVEFFEWSAGEWVNKATMEARIGRNGTTLSKREGDGCTPKGTFKLGFAFGLENPGTYLDFRKVTKDTRWVDDPKSAYYNTWQEGDSNKDWNSAEKTITQFENRKTWVAILIEHNGNGLGTGDAVLPNGGSAIFFSGRYGALDSTSGDVYIAQSDMEYLLSMLDAQKNPVIEIN